MKSMNLFGGNDKSNEVLFGNNTPKENIKPKEITKPKETTNQLPPAPIQDEEGNLTFSLEGKEYSLNVNSEEERERVKAEVNANALAQYDWFEEFEGYVKDGHWVFYDTSMYMPKKDNRALDLHYNPRCNQTPIIPINAISCRNMFSDCDKLTELNLSKLNTVNIVSMKGMFKNCRKIITLDLDNLITSKVTDMSSMFEACTKLVNLNLSNFDTSNVTHMCFMFEHNLNLTALDLSSFDTSKVTWMYYMFHDCKRLKSLDLSNFDTSNLEEMEYMFSGCESLEVLDLSNFNTFKVRMLNSAFMNCKRLTVLDIRGFYTSYLVKPYRPAESERDPNALYGYFPEIHEVSIQNLFHGCNSLKLLKVNSNGTIVYLDIDTKYDDSSTLIETDAGYITVKDKLTITYCNVSTKEYIDSRNTCKHSYCIPSKSLENWVDFKELWYKTFDIEICPYKILHSKGVKRL